MQQKFIGEWNNDDASSKTRVQGLNGISYESVTLPFIALLTGLCLALLELGIELVIKCKNNSIDGEKYSNEEESTSEKAEDIIDDIYNLLKENHGYLGGIRFLSKIRSLSTVRHSSQ